MRRWPLVLLCLLALPVLAQAAGNARVYTWKDANGVTHFSDSPPPASVKSARQITVRGDTPVAAGQEAADGEAAWYARVKNAESPEKGVWNLSGEIYNADDPKELWGDFEAVIRESDWKGKPSYVLVSIRSEMK